jgi:hypothetical protein
MTRPRAHEHGGGAPGPHGRVSAPTTHALAKKERALGRGGLGELRGTSNLAATNSTTLPPRLTGAVAPMADGEEISKLARHQAWLGLDAGWTRSCPPL